MNHKETARSIVHAIDHDSLSKGELTERIADALIRCQARTRQEDADIVGEWFKTQIMNELKGNY